MNWMNLVILILNTALTFMTNLTVNQKRDQSRSTD